MYNLSSNSFASCGQCFCNVIYLPTKFCGYQSNFSKHINFCTIPQKLLNQVQSGSCLIPMLPGNESVGSILSGRRYQKFLRVGTYNVSGCQGMSRVCQLQLIVGKLSNITSGVESQRDKLVE